MSFWADEAMVFDPVGRDAELRRAFVEEYMFDRDSIAAAQRIGFAGQFAITYAGQFMQEPYVQKLIKEQELEFGAKIANKDPKVIARVAAALFHEANTACKASARVTALTKLANMLGMDETVPVPDTEGSRIVISVTPTPVREELEQTSSVTVVDASNK